MHATAEDFLPFIFLPLWFVVGFIVSRMGWHGFAQKYAASVRPPGMSFNCPAASFGSILASYRNVMRVVFSESGVYVYPMILFRVFHQPFLIPWEKVVAMKKKTRFWGDWYELSVRDRNSEIRITLTTGAVKALESFRKVRPDGTDNFGASPLRV